jgi:hypothetical protein
MQVNLFIEGVQGQPWAKGLTGSSSLMMKGLYFPKKF